MHIALNDICKKINIFIFDIENRKIIKDKTKCKLDGGSFSHLKITKNEKIIIKETKKDISRLVNEITYLKKLPKTLKPKFTQLLDYKIDKINEYAYYTMPLYKELSLKKLILSNKINTSQTINLLVDLLSFMKNNVYSLNKTTKNIEKYVESVHLYRVYARKEITIKRAPIFESVFNAKKIIINNSEYENIIPLVDKITMCNDLIKSLQPDFLSLIHGDLHFDNILVDTSVFPYTFRLVDPKGFSVGDPMYDVSKLLHDFNGLYDFIYEYMFNLNYKIKNNILKANLSITNCKAVSEFNKLAIYLPIKFNTILQDTFSKWYHRAKFIEAINFSCLQPYHLIGDGKEKRLLQCILQE